MRPTLRRTLSRLTPAAIIVVASALALAAASPAAITLYEGSYSTDMSTSTPGGLAPASGTSLAYPDQDIALSWDPVPGAKSYELQVARQDSTSADCNADSAFQQSNIVLTTRIDDHTEWVPSMSSAEDGKDLWTGTYCWRVRTVGKGYGEWSTSNRFTRTWTSTVSGLKFYNDHDGPIPRTSASSDYASGDSITRNAGYVTWDALSGAAEYEIEVSPSRYFAASSTIVSRSGIRGTRVVLLHLPDDTYYWRVRAIAPNGTKGNWTTGTNAFTVRWLKDDWSSDANTYPADSSVQSEVRIGWTPMPGASYYQYQVGTDSGCFYNPDYPQFAPAPYGSWVGLAKDEATGMTRDPHPSQCRLTDLDAKTINNWVTFNGIFSDTVIGNINTRCYVDGELNCEPAGMPYNYVQDFGAAYHVAGESGTGNYYLTGDGQYSEAYDIYWRARPVFAVSQDHETGWTIGSGTYKAYGSWTKYTGGGSNRQHRFSLDPTTTPYSSTDTRCPGAFNPAGGCLEHIGSTMDATESPTETADRSMQFPALTWKPFSGASCYIVEAARDPLFNNVAFTDMVGWGNQQSYAKPDSLPDNIEDTGYWWRVVPGQIDPDDSKRCMQIYSPDSGGIPTWYASAQGIGGPSYSDDAVRQTFTKESSLQVVVEPNFEGASPLLRWTNSGASSTDYDAWSMGIAGAAYYDVELARDPSFSGEGVIPLKTTIPRIVPFEPGDETGSVKNLPDGLWYYRIRGVDENGVTGAWSATGTFNKLIAAPVPRGANGGSGPGVAVSWYPVEGASSYEVQVSDNSGFETGASTLSTLQTSVEIPSAPEGRRYWRVRAIIGGVAGQWSEQLRYVDIVPETTIRYGLNRSKTLAKGKVQITGELKVDGATRNGERLRLQRKTGGCDNDSGSYVDSSVAVTGDTADDGMVNIPARVLQNTCFRFAWSGSGKVRYSSPIETKVVPWVKAYKNRKVVRRGRAYCVTVRSNVAVNGRMRLQYRVGRTWRTARSTMVRNKRFARMCPKIGKAGRYSTRVTFDHMTKRGQGWKQYEDVMRGTGMVRVNDVWRIVRSR
ncbi:MAG: hypothetical protein KDC46_09125 [Thermoleophilia bacterium]|nr:hypothetical protein [Thermoleophilia bacterium]